MEGSAYWQARDLVSHSIENHSDKLDDLLEIGTCPAEDTAVYVGFDPIHCARCGADRTIRPRNERPYETGEEVPEIQVLPNETRR